MALPNKRITWAKLPGDNDVYEIVPQKMRDGSTQYTASLPTLGEDSVIALQGKVIEKVEGIEDIPNNELGLEGSALRP